MRVLVTGGTGYLGRAIVHAVERAGHEPVVFARRATAARLPGRAIDGDIRDTRAVTRAAQAMRRDLSHRRAGGRLADAIPSEFDAINVGGLQSVLAAARAHQTPAYRLHLFFPGAAARRQSAAADGQSLPAHEGGGA